MQDRPVGGIPAKLAAGPRPNGDLAKRGAGLARGPNMGKTLRPAAWSGTWPAPGATLDLDFANNKGFVRGVGQGGCMDAVTFTRASSGNYVGSDGLLRTGAGTFNGTANALGVNVLTVPQDFDNAAWEKTQSGGVTVSANVATAPDQTNTADVIIPSTTSGYHSVRQSATTTAAVHTFSYYVKPNGYTKVAIREDYAVGQYASFDLTSSGSVINKTDAATASITALDDGWYRIVLTPTTTSSNQGTALYVLSSSYTTGSPEGQNYSGDGTSGVFIWGAQLEVGSSATTYYPTNINVPRFDWASTATVANANLLTWTQQFDNAIWTKSRASVASTVATNAPDGTATAQKLIEDTSASTTHRFFSSTGVNVGLNTQVTISVYLKAAERSQLVIRVPAGGTAANIVLFDLIAVTATVSGTYSVISTAITDVGNGWYRCSITALNQELAVNTPYFGLASGGTDTYSGDGTSGIYIWGAQLEYGSLTAYKANIGQVYTYTPLAATSTCNGLLIEESRTNRLLWCRDATQANWTNTNVTAAKNQTGVDGVASAATSLTASADGGTCIQTVTLASGSRTGSVYLKRITGTGNVQVSLDGTTWSTVDLSSTEWRRIVISSTVTNPVVGIKLATNGDAVAMDYGQIEDGAFATTPILTTTATVTRSVDSATVPSKTWFNSQTGSFLVGQKQTSPGALRSGRPNILNMYSADAGNNRFNLRGPNDGGSTVQAIFVYGTGTAVISAVFSSYLSNKLAFSYSQSRAEIANDGTPVSDYSSGFLPIFPITTMTIGAYSGYLSRIAYIPATLNKNQLAAISG